MSVTAKLNECVKLQDKELAEFKWSKGMLQNELKEKGSKIEALQQISLPPPLPAVAPAASSAEIAAKDKEILELKEALQHANKLQEEQQIRIPWSATKLTASAKQYLAQLADSGKPANGTKRKYIEEDTLEDTMHLNKRALRSVMLTEADLSQDINKAMSEQQTAVAKVQRSLLQQQKALRDAQDDLEANYARKRCLEARSKVLHEQETLVVRFLSEVKHACKASEQAVQPLKEQVTRSTADLEQRRASLIDTQLS